MAIARIGEATQAELRAASLVEASSHFASKLQPLLDWPTATRQLAFFQQLGQIFTALLAPASGVAFVLGLWRITSDLGWTEAFLISGGFFSHWQVWIAIAAGLKVVASVIMLQATKNVEYRGN